jgi:radical SAM superfamily enzyme YgiQ (UPF0313 family)
MTLMRSLLISTYDLGRQPFGLASPAAWLREAGMEVACADLSRDRLNEDEVRAADLIAFFLPMHTATRLAIPVIDRVRELNPAARLCAYGLYAPLNATLLHEHGVSEVLAGEFEEALRDFALESRARDVPIGAPGNHTTPDLTASAKASASPPQLPRGRKVGPTGEGAGGRLPRLEFRTPDRAGLPPLARYATLQIGTERRTTGYTEASRGCKHLCRHCPIVPVYNGRFRIVPVPVVIADIRAQVEAGARHITFGDPDFFNGIGHAKAVVEAFGRELGYISYDVTIKVEHLLRHADTLALLRDTGCAFVTSAVESIDDGILARLDKGHTSSDFDRVVRSCADAGLVLAPTFVAFTPWTTIEGYGDLLREIARLDLIDHVAPIQFAIRLLITDGSRLLELDDIRRLTGTFDTRSLTYPWRHPDPRVDALQERVAAIVGGRISAPRYETFARIWRLAHEAAGVQRMPELPEARPRTAVPYLNEPWYC